MTDKDYNNTIELSYVGGGWIPANDKATDLAEISGKGEIHQFVEVTQRDIKFHRCYFALLNYIYSYLPKKFQEAIPENKFYVFLKHLKGNYKVIFKFKDGSEWIEYDSISFGKMSQKTFEKYIRNQLPFIYENVLALYFEGEIYNGIVDNIEKEFEKFLIRV